MFEKILKNLKESTINEFAIYPHSIYIDALNVGLASTVNIDFCNQVPDVGSLHIKTTLELAQFYKSKNLIEAAIGVAAINSSLKIPESLNNSKELNAYDIILDKGKNKNVSIIGHFPFVKRLRQNATCNNLWVFELNKKEESDLLPEDYSKYIPVSDVVLISGTTLINKTFEQIYQLLGKSYNIMLGPSTPLTEILYDFKIDVICGAIVENKILAKQYLSQGAKYKEAKGIKFVSMFKK